MKKISVLLLLILSIQETFSQISYTWNGSTSTNWNTSNNWTPVGIPGALDNVTIVTAPNECRLAGNQTVNNFTQTGGTLNVLGLTLTINGNSNIAAGTIDGPTGKIECTGTSAVFGNASGGATINAQVTVNVLSVICTRTTFNNTVDITKLAAGTSIDNWRGGNTFNGDFSLNNAATNLTDDVGDIYLGAIVTDPMDVFNGRANITITGAARIRIPQRGRITFNGVTTFVSAGFGDTHDRIQPARLTGGECIFNDSVYVTTISPTTDFHFAYDSGTSCIFNGPLIVNRLAGSGGDVFLGRDGAVQFNDNVVLTSNTGGTISITASSTNLSGSSTLANGKQLITSDFTTGTLDIENFTQIGITNQTLNIGAGSLTIGSASKPCTFNASTVDFTARRITLLGSFYNGSVANLKKTGAGDDNSGGNTFAGIVNITNTGGSSFRFSSTIAADVFNSAVNLVNASTGTIEMARTFFTSFPENINLVSTAASAGGGITFGSNGGGSELASGKTIAIGVDGYTNGYLYLYQFTQLGNTPQSLTLSGTNPTLRMGNQANLTSGCNFGGNFTATAGLIELTGNTFEGTTVFNQFGNSTTARTWGGNTFKGAHTINISGTCSILCSQLFAAETYNSIVEFNLSGTGGLAASRSFNTSYPENISISSTSTGSITFGLTGGTSTLANGKTISVNGAGYIGNLFYLYRFTQVGTTPQLLNLSGTGTVLRMGDPANLTSGSTFGGNLTATAAFIDLTGNTFDGSTVFNQYGISAVSRTWGGNTFKGAHTINVSGTCGVLCSDLFAADTYNSTVEFNLTGTGNISASRSFNTVYPENITLSSTSSGSVAFGTNGGTSTLANGKTISISGIGYVGNFLYLYQFTQLGATPQLLTLTGTSTVLRMGNPANLTSGCIFGGNLIATAAFVELTGNTFEGRTVFNQYGNSITARTWGGNTFKGAHTVNISGSCSIQCSELFAADTYNSTVEFNLTGSGIMSVSRTFNTLYPENISVSSTSTGSVAFGSNGGTSTLATGKTISVNAAGYTGTFLYLYRFTQLGTTSQSIVTTGTATLIEVGSSTNSTYGCTFNGNLILTSANLLLASNVFNGNCTFTKTGGTDDNNNGNNTFNGNLNYSNLCPTASIFVRMSNIFGPDTYNGPVTLTVATPGGGIIMARTFDGYFNDNIICNGTNGGIIYIGAGGALFGNAILASGKTITCGTFDSGLLSFRRFYQYGNTPQIITTTGTANLDFAGTITTANAFTSFEGDVTATSNGYIGIRNSTFHRNATFTGRTYQNFINNIFNVISGNTSLSRIAGTLNDDLGGGNTVNGNFSFYNTGSGRFRTGVTAYGGDIFKGNVDINNAGTGTVSFSYNDGTNTIGGNLNLSSSSTGTIVLGETATANAIVVDGSINALSGNYTNGTVNLRYVTQNGGTNNITGTLSATAIFITRSILNGAVNLETTGNATFTSSVFNANVTTTVSNGTTMLRSNTFNAINQVTSSSFVLGGTLVQGNTFNTGTSQFTKTGTSNDDVNGGNIFNGVTTFTTANTSGRWRLGASSADDFNSDVFLNRNAAGTLEPAYDASSTFAGDITVSSTSGTSITFGGGTGRVTLDGMTAQSVNKTGGNSPFFRRLTVNKLTGTVTLNTLLNISLDFNPLAGIINTTITNILNLNNGSTSTIGTVNSYVNGPMNYEMNSNGSGLRTLSFPIGKLNDWRPAVLQVSHTNTTTYTYRAEVFNQSATALNWALPATVQHVSSAHYWDIERLTTSTGVSTPSSGLRTTAGVSPVITLYYGTNDEVMDPAKLTICKNTSTALSSWIDIGGTGATAPAGSVTSTSSPSLFNSFSRFTLGNLTGGNNPLPINLMAFTATLKDDMVYLKWSTSSEMNNNYFDVEKSDNGTEFEKLTTVWGNGTTMSSRSYSAIDAHPYSGTGYYRLKQVDHSGEYTYSPIVSARYNSGAAPLTVYPNPASDVIYLKTDAEDSNAPVTLVNALGAQVISGKTVGDYHGMINVSHLPAGIYFMKVEGTGSASSIKIMIEK